MSTTTTIDKSSERVQRMFGEIAPSYDRMNHLLSLNVDRYWRWWTVRKLAPVAGEPILDVCTGTGDLALAFQRATGGKSEIVAADFCREMLEIGRRKQARAKIGSELTFVEADAQNLPFDDNRFAIVSVAFGLRNVADTDRGLAEMTRVCRPGGQVAVLEFSTPRWQPLRGLYLFYFRHILPRIGQLFAPQQLGRLRVPAGDRRPVSRRRSTGRADARRRPEERQVLAADGRDCDAVCGAEVRARSDDFLRSLTAAQRPR